MFNSTTKVSAVAIKENQTSSSARPMQGFVLFDCVDPKRSPCAVATQSAVMFTGTSMAPAQSSLAGVTAGKPTQMSKVTGCPPAVERRLACK